MSTALAAALVGAAAAVGVLGEDAASRLRVVLPLPDPPPSRVRVAGELDPRLPRGACLLAAGSVLVLAPGLMGLLLALVLVVLGPGAVRRLQPSAWDLEDREAARELPLALDLLSSCLSGGAPLDRAVGAVAAAVPGACGIRFGRVAAALAVGSSPAEAWQLLASGPLGCGSAGPGRVGTSRGFPWARSDSAESNSASAGLRSAGSGWAGLARSGWPTAAESGGGPGGRRPARSLGGPAGAAARALARAAEGGAPVAATVARIAASARAEAGAEASRAARRAGVLAVGPLGLCFLPAFVLLGVVPAIVGLAGPLLQGL